MGCFDASTSQQTSSPMSYAQRKQLEKMIDLYAPRMGENVYWEGERVAPFSDLQRDVLTGTEGYLDVFGTPQQVTGTLPLQRETGTALEGYLGMETGAQPLSREDIDKYFEEAIWKPTMKELEEVRLPMVEESYAGPGFFDAAASQARTKETSDVMDWLGERRAELDWNALLNAQQLEEAKAGRGLQAVPLAMEYGEQPARQIQQNLQIAAQQLGGLGAIYGFGQAEQTQAQRELEAAIIEFAEANQLTTPDDLAIMLSLLGLSGGGSYSTSSGAGLGYAGLSSLAGGVGQGMGLGIMQIAGQ